MIIISRLPRSLVETTSDRTESSSITGLDVPGVQHAGLDLPHRAERRVSPRRLARVHGDCPVLAEGECVGLSPGVEEGDLEGAVGDGAGLTDELIYPLLCDRAVAIAVDVASVCLAGGLSVDEDAASHGGFWCCRSHDEVEVAGVEAAGDVCPFVAFSVVASSAIVQSPERAHWLSPSRAGMV